MKKRLARLILRLTGWTLEGEKPSADRCVMIAAPHTSNWDFPLMLLFSAAFEIKVKWMAKHSIFVPPLGWFLRAMGGLPVRRDKSSNLVDTMVSTFSRLEQDQQGLILLVPTEGTRALSEHWKSGFYHIATQAGVAIIPSFLDFGRRRGGFGPAMMPTGNITVDMDYFREFYGDMLGKFPDQFGPIRLRDETPD